MERPKSRFISQLKSSAARRKAYRLFTTFGFWKHEEDSLFYEVEKRCLKTAQTPAMMTEMFEKRSLAWLLCYLSVPMEKAKLPEFDALVQKVSGLLMNKAFDESQRGGLFSKLSYSSGNFWYKDKEITLNNASDRFGKMMKRHEAKEQYNEDYLRGKKLGEEIFYAGCKWLLEYSLQWKDQYPDKYPNGRPLSVYGRDGEIIYDVLMYMKRKVERYKLIPVRYALVNRNHMRILQTLVENGMLAKTRRKVNGGKKQVTVVYNDTRSSTVRAVFTKDQMRFFVDYILKQVPWNCIHVDTALTGSIPKAINVVFPKLGYEKYDIDPDIKLFRSNTTRFQIPVVPSGYNMIDTVEHQPQRRLKAVSLEFGFKNPEAAQYHAMRLGVISVVRTKLKEDGDKPYKFVSVRAGYY